MIRARQKFGRPKSLKGEQGRETIRAYQVNVSYTGYVSTLDGQGHCKLIRARQTFGRPRSLKADQGRAKIRVYQVNVSYTGYGSTLDGPGHCRMILITARQTFGWPLRL